MFLDRQKIYEEGFDDGVAMALHAVETYLETMSDEEAEQIAQRIMALKHELAQAYHQRYQE